MSEAAADFSPVVLDGFSVSSNVETSEQIRENFESDAKPLDGEPVDPEKEEAERVSKAASELGKKGAAALAAKKAQAAKEPDIKPDIETDDSDEDPDVKARPGSGSDLRLRMKEATREAAELKRQLAAERAERAAEVKRLSTPAEPQREVTPTKVAPGKPKLEDFDDHTAFVEALADYKIEEKLRAAREEDRAASTKHRQEAQVLASEAEREAKVRKSFEEAVKADPKLPELLSAIHPDFLGARTVYGALATGEALMAKHYIADEFLSSENPILIARYLAANPNEYERLAALQTPRDVTREMAKVEDAAKRAFDSPPDTANMGSGVKGGASKAKPPVKPVTGSLNTAPDEGSDDEPFEAHARRENARERSRVRGELR